MSESGHELSAFCPLFQRAVEILGRRWTGAIIRALLAGETHFGAIAAAIPGLSDRLLTERLKELEAEQILTRTVFPETPVRIEYQLTEKGKALAEPIDAVSRWAEEWLTTARATTPNGRVDSGPQQRR